MEAIPPNNIAQAWALSAELKALKVSLRPQGGKPPGGFLLDRITTSGLLGVSAVGTSRNCASMRSLVAIAAWRTTIRSGHWLVHQGQLGSSAAAIAWVLQ
jgi:hypothetical protein